MRSHTSVLMAVVAATITLSACVAPTPYQAQGGSPHPHLGYQSSQLNDGLIRVEFLSNVRTSLRARQAYTLYRAAELAQAAGAPGFLLLEGAFNRQILEDTDTISRMDGGVFVMEDVAVSRLGRGDAPSEQRVDQVVGEGAGEKAAEIIPTRLGRMPMPRPALPRSYAPTYIYVPSAPLPPPRHSLLIQFVSAIPETPDGRLFVTQDVLDRLGPRIVRPGARS